MRKSYFALFISVFLFSLILFLVYIQIPSSKNFDEFHYVPAAKQFLAGEKNQNWEHPPLGKVLIATGIYAFGDKPFGWRVTSAVFGALTAGVILFWGFVLFESWIAALILVGFTLSNHLLYVQSRIAMLDSLLIFFLFAWFAAFHSFWSSATSMGQNTKMFKPLRLISIGVCIGLAAAIKWYALSVWVCFLGLIVFIKWADYWKVQFSSPTPLEAKWRFYPVPEISLLRWREIGLFFVGLPLALYFLSFLPLVLNANENVKWVDIFWTLQKKMFDGQMNVTSAHPYMSKWYQWPLLHRPIWYLFDKFDNTQVRGILLLGNPWLMWVGFFSIALLVYDFIKNKSRTSFLVVSTYLIFFAVWILIPRKVAFYYYYYPAGMVLGAVVIQAFLILHNIVHRKETSNLVQSSVSAFFQTPSETNGKGLRMLFRGARWKNLIPLLCFLGICICTFIYFFPILSGQRIPSDGYLKYTWFRSWI